jgi:hypothetical protein
VSRPAMMKADRHVMDHLVGLPASHHPRRPLTRGRSAARRTLAMASSFLWMWTRSMTTSWKTLISPHACGAPI